MVRDVSSGTGSYNSYGISLTAPSVTGTYYIVFAFRAEKTEAQVASATNWAYSNNAAVWNDGNDIADFTSSQASTAQNTGRAPVSWLLSTGFQTLNVPSDAILVTVVASGAPAPSPSPTEVGTAKGYVYGNPAGDPLAGAVLSFSGPESRTVTSSSYGYFEVTLESGDYVVTVSASGYDSKIFDVHIDPGGVEFENLVIWSSGYNKNNPSGTAGLPPEVGLLIGIIAIAALIVGGLVAFARSAFYVNWVRDRHGEVAGKVAYDRWKQRRK
jgi:hypothetical protein